MDEEKFHAGAWWVGSIIAGILLEAVFLQVGRRCLPGLFGVQQQPPANQPRRR
jgi:hypothetical protein